MCAQSYILRDQIPEKKKNVRAFMEQSSPVALFQIVFFFNLIFFPICYPPLSTFRWLLRKRVLFQAFGLLTDDFSSFLSLSLTICSFPIYPVPTKSDRLYITNSYSGSDLISGDELENWSRVASAT